MNELVPSQGESEGTPVSALQPASTHAVTQPLSELSVPTPQAPAAPPQAPSTALQTPPQAPQTALATPTQKATSPLTEPPVPQPKLAVDMMPPMMRQPVAAPITGNAWESDLEASSASTGVSAALMRKIANRESTNNPNARATTSTAGGVFQFIDGTWSDMRTRYPQLNLGDKMDARSQARAAPYYMKEIQANLTRSLGRKPSDAESYIGWFLGPVGSATALSADPSTPVSRVVDAASLAANPSVFAKVKTVGELYAWAGEKMGDPTAAPKTRIDLLPYLAKGHDASHLDKMDWDLKSRISNMVADMPEELRKGFQINSGFRSPERQKELFDAAVIKYGSPEAARKWVAPPGNSQHNHGRAADLNMSGDPKIKEWLHANAAKYGLGFPMGHEPWHIEVLGGREAKLAQMGSAGTASTGNRIPFTAADDAAAHRAQEGKAYSLVQAASAAVGQDWMTSYLLKNEGKQPYDPGFRVTQELLSQQAKALPENYLPYLARSTSEQDLAFRLRQSERDHEVEQRLSSTSYATGIRMAVALADPAGIALGLLSPVGFAAKAAQVGRLARFGAAAADGAIGGVGAELPAMFSKPGYEGEQALWAGLAGTIGYVALNRSWAKEAPHVADEVNAFISKGTRMQEALEEGRFGASSVGAAQNVGFIEPVRGDIEDWLKVQTPETALGSFRFDFAKLKNSENPVVAALANAMGLDTVGNKDKTVAITRPIEHEKRMLETRATTLWSREYVSAAEDYRKRNGIGAMDWKLSGEDTFQRLITGAVRNTDPIVKVDPAVQRMATAWQDLAGWWRERAINPGKDLGETRRSLPNADAWSDAKDYVPRYVAWDRWRELNATYGTQQMRSLIGRAIEAKNPDLDPDLSLKLGGWYYDRIRSVEAGQELTGQRAFSSVDVEAMRKSLTEELGLSPDEVGRVLYNATARDESGKAMTARQKMRTHMDETFTLPLTGRDGVTRNVAVHELWEDNMRSVVHAYNSQMAGAVSMAQLRIENPNWKRRVEKVDAEFKPTGEFEEKVVGDRWLVDGLHSDGDWDKLLAQARAVDDQVRYADGRKTVEREIGNLQWMKDALTGVPHEFDRTRWGQLARIAQKLNFTRLMSQSGFAGIAELGQLTGQVGWKHALHAIPHLEDFKRDAITGKLGRDVLEDFEYTFGTATDHLRGSGATLQSPAQATAMQETGTSRRLDQVEKGLALASRATAMVSLTPVTVYSERVAERAVLSKFRAAAMGDETLSAQRMRIIGLDAEMQDRVLKELRKHAGTVEQDGRTVQVIGLDKWDEHVRSAFEFAVSTWVRRIIQQNDLGQMNHVLGHPLAKLLFQFRNFTLGAWSKQTLSSIHMRDPEALNAFWASMVFGGAAYTAQTVLNGIGLTGKDREEYLRSRLADGKVAAAAIQRSGQSSLLPGFLDFGSNAFGFGPVFDTRSTGQATQGWGANPTTGLIDSLYSGVKGVSETAIHGDTFTGKDFRTLSRGVNILHNFPLVLQAVQATSSTFPAQ